MKRLLVLALVFCTSAGCETKSSGRRRLDALQRQKQAEVDEFDSAFNFVTQMHQFDPEKSATQASYHLNKWLVQQDDSFGWVADPMLARVPHDLKHLLAEEQIAREAFAFSDIHYVESANLMAAVADWAGTRPDPRLQGWFDENPDGLSGDQLDELVMSQRLFDWVVRNIQLDPTPDQPERNAAQPGGGSEASLRPSQELRPGPGYNYLPSQTLLYGHGDRWLRARAFIGLIRQRGIEATVLAIDPLRGQIRPWLTAVRVGNELYLFDFELGLPIPNADGRGIATLNDARQDASVLGQLKAGAVSYPVSADDLKRVVALIDASPEAVSKRMHILQANLTGTKRMSLTVQPSLMAKRLRQCAGVSNVAIWTVPLDAVLFQQVLEQRIKDNDPSAAPLARERFYLAGLSPIIRGRRLHLRGVFSVEDNALDFSAKNSYMGFRVDDESLKKLADDAKAQEQQGLVRGRRETDANWANRLRWAEMQLRSGKQKASYWIGLVHYESGDFNAAEQWLDRRTIQTGPTNPWVNGASYNLARVFEASDDIDAARRILLVDESPQSLGNRIRARLLREWKERSAKINEPAS